MADEAQPGTSDGVPPPPPPSSGEPANLQVAEISGIHTSRSVYPAIFPLQHPGDDDGPGIYAIPYLPYMGPLSGFAPTTMVPLKYEIPTRPISGGRAAQGHGQEVRQQHVPQRQVVVRRFHFEFQLDLALLLKLAVAVFLFSQDGSVQRLILLVFFASLIYLYQTGALSPIIRWLQHAAAPPQPRPALPRRDGPPVGHDDQNPRPEENSGVDNHNQNQPAENQEEAANENQPEPRARGMDWWAFVKEIQMIAVAFFTSLLPGFHNND